MPLPRKGLFQAQEERQMSECQHHDYTMVEDYIRGLQWSPAATDHEKSLVAGNIRGFYSHIRESLTTRPAESVAQGGECADCTDAGKDGMPPICPKHFHETCEQLMPTPATGSGGDAK
jgi:hypothetical protein